MTQAPPRLLITRAVEQHAAFKSECEQLGFIVEHLPCIEIHAVPNTRSDILHLASGRGASERSGARLAAAGQSDIQRPGAILFTSQNAVRHINGSALDISHDTQLYAIGSATADAMQHAGFSVTTSPRPPYNSEAFLELLADIPEPPESILIIKGAGGRDLLQQTLPDHGISVSTLDVYTRKLPQIETDRIDQLFAAPGLDIVSVTSNTILHNLIKLVGQHQSALLHLPLVVNSTRGAATAADLGFRQAALLATPAGDKGQLAILADWISHYRD